MILVLSSESSCQHPRACILIEADLVCVNQTYDTGEFGALVEKYDKLNWRIISKPGGATVKPDEYYTLYGQALLHEVYRFDNSLNPVPSGLST